MFTARVFSLRYTATKKEIFITFCRFNILNCENCGESNKNKNPTQRKWLVITLNICSLFQTEHFFKNSLTKKSSKQKKSRTKVKWEQWFCFDARNIMFFNNFLAYLLFASKMRAQEKYFRERRIKSCVWNKNQESGQYEILRIQIQWWNLVDDMDAQGKKLNSPLISYSDFYLVLFYSSLDKYSKSDGFKCTT